MNDLFTYALAVRQLSREGFMRQYCHPFLLVKTDEQPNVAASAPTPVPALAPLADPNESDWSERTSVTTVLPKTGSFAVLRHNAESYRVYALVPKNVTAHPTREEEFEKDIPIPPVLVKVGRAPENDIVLIKPPISKHHATFSYLKRRAQSAATLVDEGSRNGTFVKGRRLEPKKPVAVDFGDAIVLGDVALSLIGAGALWEIIRQQQVSAS